MTAATVGALARLLARTRYLLLDFDGPICAFFAGRPVRELVVELIDELADYNVDVPERLADTPDPFDVLRHASTIGPDLAMRVDTRLRAAELEAARSARPTPHAEDLIDTWRRSGRVVAAVSNNAQPAVSAYLAAHRIRLDLVVARISPDPALLKPHPYLVRRAISLLGADRAECAFVGDSPNDMIAAAHAGIPSIGYANKPGKAQRLSDAGAQVVVEDMQTIAHAAATAVTP
jgi:phosphoglycolate phosphatase